MISFLCTSIWKIFPTKHHMVLHFIFKATGSWANSTGSQYTDKLREGSCKPLLEKLPSGHVNENLSFQLKPKCMSSLLITKSTVKTHSKVSWYKKLEREEGYSFIFAKLFSPYSFNSITSV